MTVTKIDVGNLANDGTGDDLRVAFIKANDNFENLDSRIDDLNVGGVNLGTAGEGIFESKSGDILNFKNIQGGENISVKSNPTSVVIDSKGSLQELPVFSDNGDITVKDSNYLGIKGSNATKTRVSGNNVFVELQNENIVSSDNSPKLSGSLKANQKNIENANLVSADSFIGPIDGLVKGVDINEIHKYFGNNFDFGKIKPNYNNIIEAMIGEFDIELGGLTSEIKDFDIDLGSI